MSSPESKALRCCSADLVTAISAADPLGLALKLFSKNLVERATVEDVCLPTNPPTTKSCIIVTAVDRKVETDPSLFHQFTALLQEEGDILKTTSKRLVDKYRSLPEKELGPPHHTPHQPSPPQPHSPFCLYSDKLRTLYAQSELPQYSNPACYKWTPSPSMKYIDLSTIDRKGMTTQQVDERKKAALYGKITEKVSANSVKLEEILQTKPGEKLKCVLVEGPPGIGKSTLAWQVCHRWGKRKLFQQYSTILLLPLRDQRVQRAICVKHLFMCIDKDLQESVRKEVSQTKWDGKDTLIILEGLDELPSHLLSQSSIFTALLSGEALSQATILVTSRPSATEQLHKHWKQRISRHFEIRGFTEENVDKYAQSVLSDHEQLSGFRKYVSIHPHIQSMLYVPLHCVIAVTVYLQCQQSRTPPPKTLTGLYTCLTQTILSQYLNDHPQYTGGDYTLDTVFDLHIPRPVHNYFKELCRIAFEHVSDQQLIFSDMPKELHDLGFTDAVPELLLYQQSANYSYNFLHLSAQEFLAAYHISLMSPSEQEQLFKAKCNESDQDNFLPHYFTCRYQLKVPQSHFRNMFQFVAGITKFEGLDKVVVRQAIGIQENTSEQSGQLNDYSLELLYECQDVSILDTEYTYSVSLIYPSPHFCLALGYCIANSSCGWKLKLLDCSNGTQAEMILQELKKSKASHTSYSIKSIQCKNCDTDFTYKLFTKHTPETFIADTESLGITTHTWIPLLPHTLGPPPNLSELIPRMQLKTLTLSHLSPDGIEMVSRALTAVSSLKTLDIQRSKFTFQSMQAFASMLQQKSLTELNTSDCSIDSDSACCLAKALHHNTTLRKLDMSLNPVGERGALAMAEMLKHNTTLKELNLGDAKISSDGAIAMAEALYHNTTLRKLDMSLNPVGDRGALAMAEMLKHNTTLEELNLGIAKISSDGTIAMAEALHHNTTLRKLDTSENLLDERGALAMAEMLEHNNTLEELNLKDRYYSIYEAPAEAQRGIKALVESLAVNHHLKKLRISCTHKKFVESLSVYHDHKERVGFDYSGDIYTLSNTMHIIV